MLAYLKENKITYFVLLACFFIFMIISYYIFDFLLAIDENVLEDISNLFSGFFKKMGIDANTTKFDVFVKIFSNNLKATLYMIVFGSIPFLFVPVFSLVLNAFAISGLLALLLRMNKITVSKFMLGILPHGIIEIPIIILAATLGVSLCISIIKIIKGEIELKDLIKLLNNISKVYILIIVPLLFIAAVIETYITPYFMSLL